MTLGDAHRRLRSGSRANSEVDETHFSTSSGRQRAAAAAAAQQAEIVSESVLKKLTLDPMATHPQANAVVVTPEELSRMRAGAVPARHSYTRAATTDGVSSKRKRAIARKERMKKLDAARKSQQKDLTEFQREDLKAAQAVLGKAERVKIESHDQVKNMNQMCLYARCVAIRDQQLAEKRELHKQDRTEAERLDAIMERERMKGILLEEERRKRREEERKAGAAVIVKQMQHNERQRMIEDEKKVQEGLKMVQRCKAQEEKDCQDKLAAQQRAKEVFAEVLKANAAQAQAKKASTIHEKEEDNRIAEYLKEKDRRESEEEARKVDQKAEKEREIARLRAKQEKARDAQAEEDAVRARRAQEKAERKWRANEVRKAEARQCQLKELEEARIRQCAQKERRMKSMATEEKKIFNRMVHAFKKDATERMQVEEAARKTRLLASEELKRQIEDKRIVKQKEKDAFMKESERTKREAALELKNLAAIKEDKLKELQAQGIPEKYCAELARKKIIIS